MNIPELKTSINEHDAKELGLVCGLEIHQQLEGRKLFASTPTRIRDDAAHYTILRHLRASAGESGQIDAAAAAEQQKQKSYLYQGYHDTISLIELDEEPPTPVSPVAVHEALAAARLFGMQPIDEIRFMRKTVVDGSNTSGFQRTGLVAVNGKVPETDVRIDTLCLEEDSCKLVEKNSTQTIYNLSRLGIPLLEVATAPDIRTPQQAAHVAGQIGMVLRSLKYCKRGLGTIRQDVNVSIKEGVRVEIKGAQDLRMIQTLVENEMLRQHNLNHIFEELKKRGARVDTDGQGNIIVHELRSLQNSTSKVITESYEKKGTVYAVRLFGFAGLIGLETQPGRRYGSELSDYGKLMGVKGLFHSDELPKYGITQEEKDAIYHELQLDKEKDAFILIADEPVRARRAIIAAATRASDFSLRKEVRMARPDGTTSYMRPMPGAARMYPETDVSPVRSASVPLAVPKLLSEQIGDVATTFNLSTEQASRLLKDGIDMFDLQQQYPNLKPAYLVDFYYSLPSQVKKKVGVDVDIFSVADEVLSRLNEEKIGKDAVLDILCLHAQGKSVDYNNYEPVSVDVLEREVHNALKEDPTAPNGVIVGKILGKYKGRVNGKELMDIIGRVKGK